MSPTTMERKVLVAPLKVKAVNEEERTFEGLASTWDRDLGDDIIKRGAFRKTIAEWRRSKRVLPLLDNHNYFSVRDAVGKLIEAKETEEGLWTKWRIVPGVDGDEILNRLRADPEDPDSGPFIDSMSIGYRPVKWETVEDDEEAEWGITRILKEVELREVSLVLFPMNPFARIDASSVKEFADTVEMLVDRAPPRARQKLRAKLARQLQGRGAEAMAGKRGSPAPRRRKQQRKDEEAAMELAGQLAGLLEKISEELEDAAENSDKDVGEAQELLEQLTELSGRLKAALGEEDEENSEDTGEEEEAEKPKGRRPDLTILDDVPKKDSTGDDDGAPDMQLYDQLRLRRLGKLSTITEEEESNV